MSIQRLHTIVGTPLEPYFDDIPSKISPRPRIVRLYVSDNCDYLALKVFWDTHESPWRGHRKTCDTKMDVLELGEDEFITRVDGTTHGAWNNNHFLTSVRFHTNHGQIVSGGTPTSEKFSFTGGDDPEAHMASRMGLLSLETWVMDGTIHGLRPTFAEYPLPEVRTAINANTTKIKYEPTTRGSSFLRHLTSPIIALQVGTPPSQLTLHVAECTLRLLPFFSAAFLEDFNQSGKSAISLGKDTPGVVAALLEFLATGSYTYAYGADTVDQEAEGLFHLAVFVAAGKFGCAPSTGVARTAFREVLSAVSGSAPAVRLRLWRAAYVAGMRAGGNWGTGVDVEGFESWMVRAVRTVLAECRVQFEEAVREVDGFGVDLMAIVLGGVVS